MTVREMLKLLKGYVREGSTELDSEVYVQVDFDEGL